MEKEDELNVSSINVVAMKGKSVGTCDFQGEITRYIINSNYARYITLTIIHTT